MGRLRTFTRRAFLAGSVAVAGGVAFGVYVHRSEHDNPLLDDLEPGRAALNPWVVVARDGITLITPHADVGQGTTSMQAALIAEEMDLAFGQFRTSFGVPSAAYYNTASADEMAPFMSTDESFAARATREAMRGVIKLLGLQITGGSSAVPDSFDKLRLAGAVARETLKAAAARQTGIPVDRLSTEAGAVRLPDGSTLPYTDLAETAATLAPVGKVALRDPSTWRLIGRPMPRLDVPAKSTGTQRYGIDLRMPGMLYATVRLNPRRGPMIRHDATRALAMRGVHSVVPVGNGVAVIADNTWRAFRAAESVDIDWGPAPYPAGMDAHWAEVEASFVDDRLDKRWRDDGDVDAALRGPGVVEAAYRAPYVAHQPLEPLSAVIRVTAARVDVWSAHQIPRIAEEKVAAITGHDVAAVHLHNQMAGGSFGHRLEFDVIVHAAEIGHAVRDVPIKLTYRREEDFAQDYPRPIGAARGRGRVTEGRVHAIDLEIASLSSTTSQMARLGQSVPGPDAQLAAGAWNLPYAIEHFRVTAYRVPGLAPTSSWRSVGASSAGFFAESFLDEVIHAAGADPLLERLRLCDDPFARKVLEAVGDMSGWGTDPGPGRGRGVAFVNSFGVPAAEVVEVTQTEQGIRIDKVYVAADVGRVVDPVNFDNQVKGAVIWGLGHAMNAEITYADGRAEQSNFHQHSGMRLTQCPEIQVRGLQNATRVRGIGEPPVPPAAPALANAIFAATGKRLRAMPFGRDVRFA